MLFLTSVKFYLNLLDWALLPWAGIVRLRLSANQIVRCFKLKKLENYMRYQVGFLLPLKFQKICSFGLWSQNTPGQSVCSIFYFLFVWRFNLNTGGPLLHCTCFNLFLRFSWLIAPCILKLLIYWFDQTLLLLFQNILDFCNGKSVTLDIF